MENNLFKIHSEYRPTGDQPTAIDSIVKNIENGVKDQVLLGVTGSGIKLWQHNFIQSIKSSFQKMQWNTLFHIMIIINQKPI